MKINNKEYVQWEKDKKRKRKLLGIFFTTIGIGGGIGIAYGIWHNVKNNPLKTTIVLSESGYNDLNIKDEEFVLDVDITNPNGSTKFYASSNSDKKVTEGDVLINESQFEYEQISFDIEEKNEFSINTGYRIKAKLNVDDSTYNYSFYIKIVNNNEVKVSNEIIVDVPEWVSVSNQNQYAYKNENGWTVVSNSDPLMQVTGATISKFAWHDIRGTLTGFNLANTQIKQLDLSVFKLFTGPGIGTFTLMITNNDNLKMIDLTPLNLIKSTVQLKITMNDNLEMMDLREINKIKLDVGYPFDFNGNTICNKIYLPNFNPDEVKTISIASPSGWCAKGGVIYKSEKTTLTYTDSGSLPSGWIEEIYKD